MEIENLPGFLESELTYAVSHGSVLEHVGSVEIEAPDRDETETISSIIGAVGQESYGSAEELFETIIGNVGDEYIGRKFYDDRGGNPADTELGPKDESVSL